MAISVVVTLFLFLCSQTKADSNFDLAISILESGEANATATSDYISEMIGKGGLEPAAASAFPICAKWYGGISGQFMLALSSFKEKNFESARSCVNTADGFAKNCEEAFVIRGIRDAKISSSNDNIRDICRSAIDNIVIQPPL